MFTIIAEATIQALSTKRQAPRDAPADYNCPQLFSEGEQTHEPLDLMEVRSRTWRSTN